MCLGNTEVVLSVELRLNRMEKELSIPHKLRFIRIFGMRYIEKGFTLQRRPLYAEATCEETLATLQFLVLPRLFCRVPTITQMTLIQPLGSYARRWRPLGQWSLNAL